MEGNAVLITRFLTPQRPPPWPPNAKPSESKGPMDTIEKVLRFVSLVPFLDDWQAFEGSDMDMWCTSQQFLDLSAGDWEEHAILLCNYFTWIDKDKESTNRSDDYNSYIVIGTGVPEGDSVYVMRKQENADGSSSDVVLWNASTGVGYSVKDELCPLRSIGCVVSQDNIWANIQEYEEPWKLNYNLDNIKEWKPFFVAGKFEETVQCIQEETLMYPCTRLQDGEDLQRDLKNRIKDELRQWRKTMKFSRTVVDQIVGRKLEPLLEEFERHRCGEGAYDEKEHLRKLQKVSTTNKLFGFPLHQTFTDMDAVVDAVKNTRIWENENVKVKFAVAVSVTPYSNNLFSVWTYVASMVPR